MSEPRATLRRRVMLAFATLGLVLCGLFVGAVLLVTGDYEAVLARAILKGQADDYVLRAANGLPTALPQSQRLSGYDRQVPAALASLKAGIHADLQYDGQHVGVFDTRVGRLVFVVDLHDIEDLESRLDAWMAAFVALGVALSAGLGGWLAGRSLQPLRRLADAVGQLDVVPSRTRLAEGLPSDELGRLAAAIDAYQARLVESEARQQAFFAEASHELRTPIAVVRGVTEVMLDDAPDGPRHVQRLARLDRGVRELGDLTEALLCVARTRPLQTAEIDLVALACQAFGSLQLRGWRLEPAEPVLMVTAAVELPVLLRMLARRLGEAAPTGVVRVTASQLHFAADVDGAEPAAAMSSLIHRLAERLDCRLCDDAGVVSLQVSTPV